MKNLYGKEKYENIEIPKELDEMINKTIKTSQNTKKKSSPKYKRVAVSLTAASAIAVFSLSLNVNESFAQTVTEIPVIGQIAKVLIIKDYSFENDEIKAHVKVPGVDQLTDSKFEDAINKIIDEKVNIVLENGQERALEYKEAFIATGGTEEAYLDKKIEVKVDYKVFSKSDEVLSFLVYSTESLAAVYAENTYFNIDVINNEVLTLEKMLGDDYVNNMTTSVLETIQIQKEEDNSMFFDVVDSPEWKVRSDIDFYINENQEVVIVFDKYEIAPGAMGRLEYVIK